MHSPSKPWLVDVYWRIDFINFHWESLSEKKTVVCHGVKNQCFCCLHLRTSCLNVVFQDSDLGTTIGEFVEGLLSQDKWPLRLGWFQVLWFQVAKKCTYSPTQIQLLHLIEEVSPSYMTIRGKFWVRNPNTNIVASLLIPCHEPQPLDLLATWREGIEGDRRWETWWVPNALLGVAKWPARCGMPMKSWKQIMTFSWHQKLGSKGCLNHLDAVQVKLDPTNSTVSTTVSIYVYIIHISSYCLTLQLHVWDCSRALTHQDKQLCNRAE